MATRIKSNQITDNVITADDLHSAIAISTTQSGTFGSVIVDNITVDGSTITNSTGNLVIDSAGDISLNADGADIVLADDTVDFGRFKRDAGDFVIKAETVDKDIILRGTKAGSPNVTIDALVLDMSADGDATFNSHVKMNTGSSTGKFAVMSSGVHGSYDFYNNGTSYFNDTVIVDGILHVSGSSGAIRGPATFTIDPQAHGDDTGTVVIAGNLQVDGTTTTINSTTLTVDDLNITLASGNTGDKTAANGAGFTIDLGTNTPTLANASLVYVAANDSFRMNKRFEAQNDIRLGSEGVRLSTDGNGEFGVGYGQTATNNTFTVYNNTTTAFRVLPNGYVGIGGNTPSSLFDVRGTGDVNIRSKIINTGQTSSGRTADFLFGKDNGANLSGLLRYVYDATQASRRIDLIHFGTSNGLSILNDGRVGIGTQSPSTKLHVRRTDADSGQRTIYADGTQLSAISTSGTNYLHNVWIENHNFDIDSGVTDSGYRIGLNIEGYHDTNALEGILATQKNIWSRNGNNVNGTGTITNSYNLHLDTLSGGGMTITNNWGLYQSGSGTKNYFEGNVGIGIDPTEKLDVNGTILAGNVSSTAGDLLLQGRYGGGVLVNIGSERSSGGVFLGYGVQPSTTTQHEFLSTSANALTHSAYVAADTHKWWTASSGSAVSVGGQVTTMTERMRISSNGDVGIGTPMPGAALDVTRTSGWAEVHFDGASGGDLIFKDNGVNYGEVYAGDGHGMVFKSYENQHMHFLTDADATAKMTITKDGQVNIGETPPSPDGTNHYRHMLHIGGTTVNPSYEQISMASGSSSSGENQTTIRMANVGNDFYLTNNYYNWGTHRYDEANEGQAFFKMLEDGRFSFGGRSSASTSTPSYNAAISGSDGSISAGSSMTMVNGMAKMNVVGNSDTSDEDVELRIIDYDDSAGSAIPTISFYKGTNTGPSKFADIRLNDVNGFAFRDNAGEDLLTIGLDGLTRVNGRLSGGELGNADIVRKDLHFYVDFNDKACVSGTSATEAPLDLSPTRYNLTLHGGANFEHKDGIGTYYFDGSDDHININNFQVADASNTYEVWHWSNSQSGWETFWDSGTERPLLGLIGNQLRAYPSGTNFATIDTGKWYHIVFAFASDNDLDVYVNGHRVAEAHNFNHVQRTGTFTFWLGGDTTHEGTNGYIGIARAYTRQLTSQEVKQNYNAEVSRFATATPSLGIVQSDGNVGIGIDSPSEILEVYNNATIGNTVLHVHNDKTGDAAVLKLEGKRTSINDTAQIIFANNGHVGSTIRGYSSADDGDIRFYVSQAGTGSSVSQAMRIADTGNLEVTYNADVGGNVDIDGTLHIGQSGQVVGNKWHGSHENIYWNSKLHSSSGHGNSPDQWFTQGAVTITSEHPHYKGFSTSYTNTQSAAHTTVINNATPSTPHWKGVYVTWSGATNYGGQQNSSIGGGWENGEGSIMKMVYDGSGASNSTNAVRGKIWKNFFSAGQVFLRQSFFYYIESGQFSSGNFAGYSGYVGSVNGNYDDPGGRHLHTASQTWTYVNHAAASYLGATYNNATQNYLNGFGFTPGVASVVWIAIPGLTTQLRNDGKTINIHRATQQIGQS